MGNAAALIAYEHTQVGYKEGANNNTKYGDWYGLNYQPWCAMFISYCAARTGNTDCIPHFAACVVGVAWFRQRGLFDRANPKPGDIVFYGPGGGTHVETVIAATATALTTIGGNTNTNGSPNGDGVYIRTRNNWQKNPYVYGFGHPAYTPAPKPTPAPVPKPTPPPAPVPHIREDDMAFTEGPLTTGPNLILVPPTNGGAIGWGAVYLVLAAAGGNAQITVEMWSAARLKASGNGWATVGTYTLGDNTDKIPLGIPAGISKILATRTGDAGALATWGIEAKQAQ